MNLEKEAHDVWLFWPHLRALRLPALVPWTRNVPADDTALVRGIKAVQPAPLQLICLMLTVVMAVARTVICHPTDSILTQGTAHQDNQVTSRVN